MRIHALFSASEFAGGFIHAPALVLGCALTFPVCCFSQQPPSRPKKVLTPQQQLLQQEMREVGVKREILRAQAKQAFDAEMAHQKAGDCPDAQNTYQFNVCYGKAAAATDQSLTTYEDAIRNLLDLRYPNLTGQPPMPGPAGPNQTPEDAVAEFDRMEDLWHSYLDTAATAAFHQFGGGTGGPSFSMETHLRLVRSHMLELNDLYGMLLRL